MSSERKQKLLELQRQQLQKKRPRPLFDAEDDAGFIEEDPDESEGGGHRSQQPRGAAAANGRSREWSRDLGLDQHGDEPPARPAAVKQEAGRQAETARVLPYNNFGNFFGPSTKVVSKRVLEEAKAKRDAEEENRQILRVADKNKALQQAAAAAAARAAPQAAAKSSPAKLGGRTPPPSSTPGPAAAKKGAVAQQMKKLRDFSFLTTGVAPKPAPAAAAATPRPAGPTPPPAPWRSGAFPAGHVAPPLLHVAEPRVPRCGAERLGCLRTFVIW